MEKILNGSREYEVLPTATELFLNHFSGMHYADVTSELIEKYAIKFAKLHVQAVLKLASENAMGLHCTDYIDKDSILNSYPLDNIK